MSNVEKETQVSPESDARTSAGPSNTTATETIQQAPNQTGFDYSKKTKVELIQLNTIKDEYIEQLQELNKKAHEKQQELIDKNYDLQKGIDRVKAIVENDGSDNVLLFSLFGLQKANMNVRLFWDNSIIGGYLRMLKKSAEEAREAARNNEASFFNTIHDLLVYVYELNKAKPEETLAEWGHQPDIEPLRKFVVQHGIGRDGGEFIEQVIEQVLEALELDANVDGKHIYHLYYGLRDLKECMNEIKDRETAFQKSLDELAKEDKKEVA